MDGRPVRLAGQDSRRGTFASRFATVIDRTNANEWTPLANLTEDQAQFYVYDSLLSEYAALGFEYGYAWPPRRARARGRRSSATS